MAIWLKDLTAKNPGAYTVPQINTIPTGAQGVSVFAALLATSLCMVYPLWSIFSIVQAIYILANISLLIWNIPKSYHFACYYLLGVSAAITPILMPFINMALRDDAEARAVTVGAMLTAGWAVFSFYPITVFPIVEGPRWTKGYAVNVCFIVGCWATFLVMQYLYKKSESRNQVLLGGKMGRDDEDMAGVDADVDVDVKDAVEVGHTDSRS
jgi:hypothetical protein